MSFVDDESALDRVSQLAERARAAREAANRRQILAFVLATAVLTGLGFLGARFWLEKERYLTFAVRENTADRKFAENLARIVKQNSELTRIRIISRPSGDIGPLTRREADLVIFRADVKAPSNARALAVVEKDVLLMAALKSEKLTGVANMKGKKIAVVGQDNQNAVVLNQIFDAYNFSPVAKHGVKPAPQENKLNALLGAGGFQGVFLIAPLTKLIHSSVYADLTANAKIEFIDFDNTGILKQKIRGLAEETIDAGLFSAAPKSPADDISTLSIPEVLLVRKQVSETRVADLAKIIFENKAELAVEGEFASAIEAPDTEKDAAILIHPGAAQYLDNDEKSLIDRYSDVFYIVLPMFSVIGSIFAAIYAGLTRVQAGFGDAVRRGGAGGGQQGGDGQDNGAGRRGGRRSARGDGAGSARRPRRSHHVGGARRFSSGL